MAAFELFKRIFGNDAERRDPRRAGDIQGACILVVDDSPTIQAVIGKMLSQDGHIVLKAGDGETAIEIARRELPDLIFLDIVMPGMNGFTVLRTLRRDPLTQEIPIVMISGNLQATEQFYVQRFGADDFMKKPFGRSEVFARIQLLTKSGRLQVRERGPIISTPVVSEHDAAEHETIPDIAMPDSHDLLESPDTVG